MMIDFHRSNGYIVIKVFIVETSKLVPDFKIYVEGNVLI